MAAQQRAENLEPSEPPLAFGTSIHFRPTKKARQQGGCGAHAVVTAATIIMPDDDADAIQEDERPADLAVSDCAL